MAYRINSRWDQHKWTADEPHIANCPTFINNGLQYHAALDPRLHCYGRVDGDDLVDQPSRHNLCDELRSVVGVGLPNAVQFAYGRSCGISVRILTDRSEERRVGKEC